ncbi:helix-turn-helix domain-containing protein [Paenibacillus radicis (ex Xue et al. 2023)]|uniref:Helix-turn-helix domain-containing protein n=1 Tax=Paenibacillus radicis (ex Xue et al. 2023) TaxID=2972489 RepID=A0ABT1YJT3_9BACL|nr:helix-turn-helix transcriptional regulator [Paenibacillus radicis (ex Xue et al. 2023)]MCR8633441.1 helix-turn-helix domain-containing protein [Paenibacillus radicis (ex Xue et al. 2023)]
MKIGKVLTELRSKKNLTQDQMADALGVKRPRYNAWENDISKPDLQMIDKIAEYHKITVDYILGRESNLGTPVPTWATSRDKRDFKQLLEEDPEIMFDGVPLDQEDREKVLKVMEAIFWDAKKKNKRKPIQE